MSGVRRCRLPGDSGGCSDECSPVETRRENLHRVHVKGAVDTSVNIVAVNCRSLRNKIPEFVALQESCRARIILGTESWLKPEVESAEVFSDMWTVYRKDRLEAAGGGVFIAVDKHIASAEVEIESTCEVIWTRITGLGDLRLIVGCFYRPPDSAGTVVESFKECLTSVVRRYPNHAIVVGGDFNLPSIDWDVYSFSTGGTDRH